ncbi:MAG: hypothetical protein IPF54_03510 [Draconibacterium sp.]|nr:hypothetical protein [Draconibacterium sp.]
MSGGSNGVVEFTGTSNATISGTTNFEELIISKGSLSSTLTITGNAIVLSSGSLTLMSGLITVPSGGTFAVYPSNALTIPSIAGFDVTGGLLSTGNFTISNRGLIRISSGTVNFGTNSGNSVETLVDGVFQVSGSSVVNIAGRLENSAGGTLAPLGIPSGIRISGGTVTLATVGNGLSNVGSLNVTTNGAFHFTGGTIVLQRESTAGTAIDIGIVDGTGNGAKTTIGGTFQFGNAFTPVGSVFNISSNIPMDNITSFPNADLRLINDVTVGQFSLNAGSTIDLNNNSINLAAASTGVYNFPLDNGSGVSIPVTINLTSGTFGANPYIEIESLVTKYLPYNKSITNFLNRSWFVTTNEITNPVYNITATYADADISGTESEIALGSWSGSLPWFKYGNANTSTNTVAANGITSATLVFAGITSDPPTVTISATNSSICTGNSTTLTANAVGDPTLTYSWTSNPAGYTSGSQNITVSPVTTTIYTVVVTDGNGFTATDDIAITVNLIPIVLEPC